MDAPKFDDSKYVRSSLAEAILPYHLRAPFNRRLCVRAKRCVDGTEGLVWTIRAQNTITLCGTCGWLAPTEITKEYEQVPVHWIAVEERAVAMTRCTRCRNRHLEWASPENCTGCIRAMLEVNPRYLPAFPVLQAAKPWAPQQETRRVRIVPAGAEEEL